MPTRQQEVLFEIEQAKQTLSARLGIAQSDIRIKITDYGDQRITSMSLHGPADAAPEVKQAVIKRFEKRIKRIRQEQEEMDDRW